MKPYLRILQVTAALLTVLAVGERVYGQCTATYSTANNFCDLDSLYLTVHPSGGTEPYTFLWETDETTQTISIPLAVGDYSVTVTDADGCVVVISCHIKPGPLVLYYPFNQNACEGDTVTLFLEWYRDSIPGATYLWSTGETTPTIQITDDIVWSVTVTDPNTGCEFVIPPGLFDFHPTPFPEIVGPNMICDGQTITLSVEGGPFGSILWLPDFIYSDTLAVTQPGTYTVIGTSLEADYCWNQDTITIVAGEIDPPLLEGPSSLCAGQSGTIHITNSSEYTAFLWSNGQTSSSITINQPGLYSVTVTNSGGCTATGSYTIGDGADFNATSTIDPATCGESNGSIDLEVSPPDTYGYTWSNGSNTEDLTDIPGGSYTVTVTSSGGCTSVSTVFVPDNPILITITEIITPNTSCNNGNGAIDITIQPSGTLSYQWSNGATTEDIAGLSPGSYTVTVTLGENCTATETYLIENNINAPIITATTIPATCGQSNGAIDLVINGGEAPFTIIWSNGASTEDLNDIPADSYSVTVTGANGCEESEFIVIPDDEIPISLSAEIIPVTSCVETNGSIDLTVSPSGVYTFLWSNGATTEDITNLSEGVYSVEVTLGESCVETATFIVVHEGNQVEIAALVLPNSSCTFPNGTVDLTVTPEDVYTYLWSNGATTEDLQDLAPGIYSVTITDSENCSSFGTYTIENEILYPVIISLITSATCGQNNGAIDLTIIPSSGNAILWSNGAITEDLQDIAPGGYTVTVTGANGCTVMDTFDVQNINSNFSLIAVTTDNSSCVSPDGSIDLTLSPAAQYTFLWSNGLTTEDLQSLIPGSYTVTVTDSLGCAASATFIVGGNTMGPILTALITPATCGQSNGAIDLSISPPGSNTFSWSHEATDEDLASILPGSYTVTVTGPNGCMTIDTFDVQNINSNFSLSSIFLPNTSCVNPNGSIDLTITPSGNYTILWSNGMSTEDLQNLAPGTYAVTVTDSLNCIAFGAILIESNTSDPVITQVITPSTCGLNNGMIDLNVTPSGGNAFAWSHGVTSEDIQNLASGSYSVTVTGTNGCTAAATFTVPNISTNFSLTAIQTPNNSCVNPNGSLDLIVSPAGVYTFLWSNGATTEDIQTLTAGSYTVTVTDSVNCTATETFVLESTAIEPVIAFVITPATCGQDNGAVDLDVLPAAGNIFAWSNGSVAEDLQNLAAGNYTVTVTGTNGCTATASFDIQNINSNFSLSAIPTHNNSCVNPNGAIDLFVNPSGSYSFLWSNGATTEDVQNLIPGMYQVTVTDTSLCEKIETVIIENHTSDPVVTHLLSPATCGENTGSIDLTVTPSAGNTYIWSDGETQQDLNTLAPGIYSVTVTDAQGCTWSADITVPALPMFNADLGADLVVEYGQAVTLRVIIDVPVTALDTVIWMPGELFTCEQQICLEQTITPLEQTEVVVMIFDTNGCMAEESVMLFVRSVIDPAVFIPNVFSPNADGVNDVFTVLGNPDVEEIVDLRIFDRWGEFVFQNQHFPPNNFDYGWDGSYRSKVMEPQVFVYWTIVKFTDGSEELYKGDVTLVR